jgi:hypothetical protein
LDNAIVEWNGSSWVSIAPEHGFQVYDKETEDLYKFTSRGWEPGAYNASQITFAPTGALASTNVQAALVELDTEKEPADNTILKAAAIGATVQAYNANTVVDANYVHTDNNYTNAEKTKLSGIAEGAEVNVNADWTAVSGDALILNKPTLGDSAALNVGNTAGTVAATLSQLTVEDKKEEEIVNP